MKNYAKYWDRKEKRRKVERENHLNQLRLDLEILNQQHKMMEVSLGTNGQHEAMDLHVKGILEAHQYEKAMLSICAVPPMNKPQKRKSLIKSIFCCDETKKAMSDLAQMMRRQAG